MVAFKEEDEATGISGADTSSEKPAPSRSNGSAIKRGFFDNPKPAKAKLKPQLKEDKGNEVPFIKAMRGAGTNSAKQIPDFMRVDQQANPVEKLKKQMIDALAPTPAVMSRVLSDPALLSGFDDPEVMSAVAEISRDPTAMTTKYRNNTKVAAFYRQVAGMVAGRLEEMGGGG
eukprot:jgi/Chlat1/3523/Chrsp23S03701